MSITIEQVQGLTGKVFSQDSGKVGGIEQIYLDDSTNAPTWVTAKTGLFGSSETFVPLEGARVDGDDLYVAFSQDQIKNAPRIESDGSLSPQEEDELYRYYGLGTTGTTTDTGADHTASDNAADYTTTDNAADYSATQGVVDGAQDEAGTVGHDTSGPTTDDAMTRSEERLNVGTASREAGRARLRKFVTTEKVTQTVPVSHEEVTLEREPITDTNFSASQSGPAISEEEHEVVLHEEVPVVDKDVVAVERIKLGKETVTENQTVSEDVRKENVELVDPETSGTR